MALDSLGEHLDGGAEVLDSQGRPVFSVVPKHTVVASNDTIRGVRPADPDGRVQIVLTDAQGNDLSTAITGATIADQQFPGVMAPSDVGWVPNTTVWTPANSALFSRFVPSKTMVCTRIAFAVAVAASVNDSIDVGIYDAAGNRLTSSGSTAGQVNSTGVKIVTVSPSITLTKGTVYYAAMAYGAIGGTAAQIILAQLGTSLLASAAQLFGPSRPDIRAFSMASFPLPTLAITTAANSGPMLAVRT